MPRVFISYAQQDSEAALYLAAQLRAKGIDTFLDYERLMNSGRFTRRLANEIRSRECVLLLQTPDALDSQQVLTEIRYAHDHNIHIIPVILRSTRDMGELAFLVQTVPIDMTLWTNPAQVKEALAILERRLKDAQDAQVQISAQTASTLTEVTTLKGHTSWVRTVVIAPDGRLLASASNDNTIRIWEIRALNDVQCIAVLSTHIGSVWGLAFSANSTLLASCGNDTTVRVWDVEGMSEPYEFARFTDHHEPVFSVSYSPDGRLLASASHDNSVHIRDITRIRSTGRSDGILPLVHSSQVYSVAFAPRPDENGRIALASGSRDSTIRIWRIDPDNMRDLARVRPDFLVGHTSWVNMVAFSPTGSVMASTSNDKTIRLWDTSRMRQIGILNGHTAEVNTVAFSPDGKLLASSSKDNSVRLWNIAAQREVAQLKGHQSWVNSATFSPDGSLLITAAGDNTIRFWGVDQAAQNGS